MTRVDSPDRRGQRTGCAQSTAPGLDLTVLIPCKNENHNIRACVESIRGLADEILVADSGSTDGTLETVRALGGCRIIEREYVNSADFKNWAIPQAAHGWVFIVDADERVPAELAAEVEAVLREPREDLDAYACAFQDFFLGYPLNHARWDTESIRLIRRDTCRYRKRRVHSNIEIDRSRVGKLKTRVQHYSIRSYEEFIGKYNRYTTWGAEELHDRGKHATYYSLLVRPTLRFLHLYLVRRGILDGLAGLQVCILMAFFSTFVKQGKLWEMEHSAIAPRAETPVAGAPTLLKYPGPESDRCDGGREPEATPSGGRYKRAS
ncbi:MAG: glycosyltransferase family 2 protein [Thermoguttaceae bacterium]